MAWRGEKIKAMLKSKGITQKQLADSVGVSRQAVIDWIKGQVPKGFHLMALCRELGVAPDYFFTSEALSAISVPLHRKRGGRALITPEVQEAALELAKQYELLFRQADALGVLPVIRIDDFSDKVAHDVAQQLREMSGIERNRPLDLEHTFSLLTRLGIIAIFRPFPENIKAYAFHVKIHGHRVVLVNTQTKLLDLVFALLHEAVHCLRDEKRIPNEYDKEEEGFCDLVASYVQFPDDYVRLVATAIMGRKPAIQINILKDFSLRNQYAMFGINKMIKALDPGHRLRVGPADSNLRKDFESVDKVLFCSKDPRKYALQIGGLSPIFLKLVKNHMPEMSDRRLAEILGLESGLDAKEVRSELMRMN